MVNVVRLGTGEEPPKDQDWLLVQCYPSGKYMIFASATSGMQGPYDTAETALDKARETAKKWGLSVIYAKGLPYHG